MIPLRGPFVALSPSDIDALVQLIMRGGENPSLSKRTISPNQTRPVSCENPANNNSGFLINDPALGVVGSFMFPRMAVSGSPVLPLTLLEMRRFLEMSLAYHSFMILRNGASSSSPSRLSTPSKRTQRISCSGRILPYSIRPRDNCGPSRINLLVSSRN